MATEHDDDALWLKWRIEWMKIISDEISERAACVTANLARQVQVDLDEYPTSPSPSPDNQLSPRPTADVPTPDFSAYSDICDGYSWSYPLRSSAPSSLTDIDSDGDGHLASSSSAAAGTQSSNIQSHGPLREVQLQTPPTTPENALDKPKSSKKTLKSKGRARSARNKKG